MTDSLPSDTSSSDPPPSDSSPSNPFQSPHDGNQSPAPEMSSTPAGIAIALFLGLLLTLWQVGEYFVIGYTGSTQNLTLLIGAVFSLMISLGLLSHSSPAWAIARFYFLFHAVMSSGFCLMAVAFGKPSLAIVSGLIQAGLSLGLFLALGGQLVRKYHRLECPNCHHLNSGGDDLLCFQRRCSCCGYRW